jgi:hypothetical protein
MLAFLPQYRLLAVALAAAPVFCTAQTQSIEKPEIKVGDTWTYNRTTNVKEYGPGLRQVRVAQVNDKGIQVVVTDSKGKESDEIYTREWNDVSTGDVIVYPHTGFFRFPLQVGSSYQTEFELVLVAFPNGRVRHRHSVRVSGWEEVQVPAGKFRAVKVETQGTWQRLDNNLKGTSRIVLWYVPEMRSSVKFTLDNHVQIGSELRPGEQILDELLGYKLE